MDAIIVGVGTVEHDDPQLTVRPPGPRRPVRVVLDSSARIDPGRLLVRTAADVPVLIVVTERAALDRRERLASAGCDVLALSETGSVPIPRLLDELGRRSMTNVLVEGGGRILGAFLDAGQIDAVAAFVAPILEGGDHPRTAVRGMGRRLMSESVRLRDVRVDRIGDDVLIGGRLPQSWRLDAGFGSD